MLYLISAGLLLVGFGVLIKALIDGVSKIAESQVISNADDVYAVDDVSGCYIQREINRDLFEEFGDESIYGNPVYDERWDR